MKELFKDLFCLIIISVLVVYGWQGLEILMLGKINPNNVDSVVGLVLILSLYGNMKTFVKFIKNK